MSNERLDDPSLDDTFWQSLEAEDPAFQNSFIMSKSHEIPPTSSQDELIDEASSRGEELVTRVSLESFHFYKDGQRQKQESAAKNLKPDPHTTYLSFCELESKREEDNESIEDTLQITDSIVLLTDIDEEEVSSHSHGIDDLSLSGHSAGSESSLPPGKPPHDRPIRTCKAPKRRRTVISILGANTNHSVGGRYSKSQPRHNAGRSAASASSELTSAISNVSPTGTPKVHLQANSAQLVRSMPSAPIHKSATEDSFHMTIAGRWERQCENLLAPFFFDLWEGDDGRDDDDTQATFEDEMSYEDEGNVDVLVAVQATVLGTDFPEVLSPPKRHRPMLWGNNFVGVVQSAKGNTVHSRKFPPGCRVASNSAWSAPIHKPYIVCNSSNLLHVPPLDGLHLDATEVSVIVAVYLFAFQALHHGQRLHRQSAYESTALEGQRILILSHDVGRFSKMSTLNQSLVDARIQAAVRMALWAGARDVHVTVPKVGNAKRNIFGNDYRVRLLDTPAEDWTPMLQHKINLVLDFTGGVSFGANSTSYIAEKVLSKKNGRYVGCLGGDCASAPLTCQEEAPTSRTKQSAWSEGLSLLQGKSDWSITGILPSEGKDVRHVVEWTAICMKMQRASLFDFYGSWKHDRRLAERDFYFLLGLLAKRQIRPNVAKILDGYAFPSVHPSPPLGSSRSMGGAVVCEPWSLLKGADNLSCSSSLS